MRTASLRHSTLSRKPNSTLETRSTRIDHRAVPLNITLGRAGGYIVDPIIGVWLGFRKPDKLGAQFTETSALYQLVVDETANYTLEEYSWAIPKEFNNTTNPEYQIGLFNPSVLHGADGNDLFG
ncbi:hypothetical protein AnigIFM63309_006300 [Aspergillus niger]|nr:hypothetical protein AnigIFM63309_006300 [Aspergillus niger]